MICTDGQTQIQTQKIPSHFWSHKSVRTRAHKQSHDVFVKGTVWFFLHSHLFGGRTTLEWCLPHLPVEMINGTFHRGEQWSSLCNNEMIFDIFSFRKIVFKLSSTTGWYLGSEILGKLTNWFVSVLWSEDSPNVEWTFTLPHYSSHYTTLLLVLQTYLQTHIRQSCLINKDTESLVKMVVSHCLSVKFTLKPRIQLQNLVSFIPQINRSARSRSQTVFAESTRNCHMRL